MVVLLRHLPLAVNVHTYIIIKRKITLLTIYELVTKNDEDQGNGNEKKRKFNRMMRYTLRV